MSQPTARLTITASSHPEFDFFLDLRDAGTDRQLTWRWGVRNRIAETHQFIEDLQDAAGRTGTTLLLVDETGEVL